MCIENTQFCGVDPVGRKRLADLGQVMGKDQFTGGIGIKDMSGHIIGSADAKHDGGKEQKLGNLAGI